jgi:altronate dehydratase
MIHIGHVNREMIYRASTAHRQTVSAAHLTVGLQCGGSDGWSGVTANPALGAAVDLLVAHGGRAMLSETPEIWGAEHLLLRRATTPEVADRLLARLDWWRAYADRHGMELNNNPSPLKTYRLIGYREIMILRLNYQNAVLNNLKNPLKFICKFNKKVKVGGY